MDERSITAAFFAADLDLAAGDLDFVVAAVQTVFVQVVVDRVVADWDFSIVVGWYFADYFVET